MSQKTYAVSEIVSQIKATIEQTPQLQQVAMVGELSNVAISANGHWYFTLKDEKARLSCVMFSRAASRIRTPFKEGDQVIVLGSISMYEASGAIQCYVSDIQLSGQGNLYAKLEQTRKKLAYEGLFNDDLKKAIPAYPMTIGLVTSDQTAAYFDVVSTLTRRWPMAQIIFQHTQVQGNDAIEQIKQALKIIDNKHVDVMLLVRGGGSIEDLWCFNDESVVRTIAALNTPIISGVGHESDLTLVDYVVDKRAPTPTGAAELATPSIDDVRFALAKAQDSLYLNMQYKLEKSWQSFNTLKHHRFFEDPSTLTSKFKNDLVLYRSRLEHSLSIYMNNKQTLSHLNQSLLRAIDTLFASKAQQLIHLRQYTQSLSLDSALARGFSITRVNNQILASVKDIKPNDILETTLSDGIIISQTQDIKENSDE